MLTLVTEEDVRFALRWFRDDAMFAACRLGMHVRQLYPSASLRTGLMAIVESAFQDTPASQPMRLLRDIIFACDLEEGVSREAAAKRIGIGLRTLFRKRADAIRIIAAHFNALIAASQSDLPFTMIRGLLATEPLGHGREPASQAFSAVRAAFDSSSMHGDTAAMQQALARLNGSRRLLDARETAELAVMQAGLDLANGRPGDAASRLAPILDVLTSLQSSQLTRRAILAKAQLSFLTGNLSDAEAMARLVDQGGAPDALSAASEALCGRIAILTESAWNPPVMPAARAYDRLNLGAIEARHTLCRGECVRAHEASLAAYDESMRCGFLPVAAYSAATLAASSRAAHLSTSDHWASQALQLLAASGCNAQIAKDLFQFPYASGSAVQWFDGASCSELATIYLALNAASELDATKTLADSLPVLLRAILMRAYDHEDSDAMTEALVEQLWNSAGPRDRVVHAYSAELRQIIAFGAFLKILTPVSRQPAFERRFRSAASITVRAVTRTIGYRNMRALSIVS